MREVAVAILDGACEGSISSHCKRVSEHLARVGVGVTVVSSTAVEWKGCTCLVVDTPAIGFWRRLDYVFKGISRRLPNALRMFDMSRIVANLRFGYDVRRALHSGKMIEQLDGLIYYQHATIFGISALTRHVPCVLVSHGDILSHPLRSFPVALRLLYVMGARSAYRRSAAVIAVSKYLADVATRFRPGGDGVYVVPNGIDVEPARADVVVAQQAGNPKDRPFRLLFVGRLAPEKGVDVLVRAMRLLPVQDFELTIVGGGPLEPELKAMVLNLALESVIRFRGQVEHGQVAEYYKNADALIVPSHSEGQGVVIIEAMSFGVPVIASRVGGIPELIADGATGLLFSAGDSDQLAAQITRLRQDALLRSDIGENARTSASQYGWDAILLRIERVLRSELQ